jgi:hypothetical protein
MAKNIDPIYPKIPRVRGVAITAANTRSDGVGTIGTDIFLVGTVSATDGAFIRFIELWPTASVAGTSTTATVARAFLSEVSSGATTVANTNPIGELPLSPQSAANSTAAVSPIVIQVNKQVDAGKSILITNHAAPAANTQWKAVAYWGDYDA